MSVINRRLPELDGWRATSILLVLAGHLLPIGPSLLRLNDMAGAMGMALFFAISGFLIVRFLAEGMPLGVFALRRGARIVPLAWTAMIALFVVTDASLRELAANLLFVSNLPPVQLMDGGEHLWSLCVEMQFYVAAALLCLAPKRRGLYLVPFLCFAVTSARILAGERISIVTWHRADEILAGGTIALAFCGWLGARAQAALAGIPPWAALLFLALCSHPTMGPVMYLRPYAAALVIGSCVHGARGLTGRILRSRPMAYVAEISYALYVIHGTLVTTWLGTGDTLERYLKRPLLFAATFALAHISTRWLEKPVMRFARRLEKRDQPRPPSE